MAEPNRKMSPVEVDTRSATPTGQTRRGGSLSGFAEQTVVQCPACQTKFLVAAATLKEVEFPRFHCSRCDHLFSLDLNAIPGLDAPPPAPPAPIPAAESAPPPGADHRAHSGRASDDFTPLPDSAIDDFGIVAPPPVAGRATGTPSRALEIPRHLAGGPRVTAPIESLDEAQPDPQIEFDFIASSVPSDRLFEDERAPTRTASVPSAPRTPPALPPLEWATRGWRGAAVAFAPIGACLAALTIVAIWLDSGGALRPAAMAQLFPAAPRVAPADLRLNDTTFETVALSSGETIRVITGTLTNGSDAEVRNVVLEGLTFNAAGDPIATVRVTSGATLSHSRLQSLTPDIITELQSGGHAKPLHLKAGEAEKVTLAVTDPVAADARFYSARVFSVR